MTEFNFFETLEKSKGAGQGLSLSRVIRLAVLIVAACAVLYGVFAFQTVQLKLQLAYLSVREADETLLKKYGATQDVSRLVSIAGTDAQFMDKLEDYAESASTGNVQLLELINNCMVDGSHLLHITVSGEIVALEGYAKDITSLMEIESNFRTSGHFKGVLIEQAEDESKAENLLKFSCQLTLEGGAILDEDAQ